MSSPAITIQGVHKSYRMGRSSLHVLRGTSFEIKQGEFVAIVGASGSGKSTLLHLIGLLDRPDKGKVALDGIDSFLPDPGISPVQLARMKGRERRRAYKKSGKGNVDRSEAGGMAGDNGESKW